MRRMAGMLMVGGLAVALGLRARARRSTPVDVAGQTVLITGGSRGLGLALAREFVGHGARVALCGRDAERLAVAEDDLRRRGGDVLVATCDVADRGAVERLVAEVAARLGPVDILVNNAGIIHVAPVADLEIRDFEDAMAVNFWGMVHATFAVLPAMQRRGRGRIVNITSIGGKVSVPHLLPYSAAKFAAVGFSEGLASELRMSGIQVLTVAPGLMRTGSYLHALVKGNVEGEARWFALSATLPLISMAATRAARQIVRATMRDETERVLSVPALVLARAYGIAPSITRRLFAFGERVVLPRPVRRGLGAVAAGTLERQWPFWLRALTILGRRAARDLHQRRQPPRRKRETA